MAKKSSTERKVSAAFHEVYHDEPSVVAKTRKKSGEAAARKQKIAIALSKARAAGADIPKKHDGGLIPQTGPYQLQVGEKVIPTSMPMGRSATGTSQFPHLSSFAAGGMVPKTGTYQLHAGERVIPAKNKEPKVHDMTPGTERDMHGNNCCVLGTGTDESDHAHVARVTPMDTKRKEMEDDPRYLTSQHPGDMNEKREQRTTRLRNEGDVRPLGGNK